MGVMAGAVFFVRGLAESRQGTGRKEINTEQREASPPRGPLQLWQRIPRRWKMTMAGAAMGALASGLWTAPAAYYAFKGGYMTHGVIHVIASVAAVVIAATIMHLSGIRQERELNAKD